MRSLLLLPALLAPSIALAAPAADTLRGRVEAKLAEAGPGVRFGLMVASMDGREILAIDPDGRFVPASNTKLFTTIAAFELLPGLDQPDVEGGALVRLAPQGSKQPIVILEGRGDARLSSAPDCRVNCLATLADAVAARNRRVAGVVGAAPRYADERWSFGMSWNNIPTRSGTALAALTVDDNELALRVVPGAEGQPPQVQVGDYVRVVNQALTVREGKTALEVERLPGERTLRLTGTIAGNAGEQLLRLGIDDPAEFAAWRMTGMLRERGVRVGAGPVGRYLTEFRSTSSEIARVTPPPLAADIVTINKVSQNVHAELLLRRLGAARDKPSVAGGLEAVRIMLDRAGVPERAATLADGSGMSPYNRVSPRGMVTMLRWASGRPWGAALRASLPVGGVDGTLARRFREGGLKGRIFAKTGSLNATSALSGYMLTAGGETLVFSIIANDVPEEVRATLIMDQVLELVAASG
ncbi:D-alanyl-D-alanine carboxypeptidase/D-alanyl-D-alanine-endopeptidase [Sphingomonas sp. LHG3406-1]|uniref:D-alanyl-D-alanine carboxypeptidase/D-alanyl-D-alanine endopeptidase n=1 Tax=Sphingomonas sp. LHG3406-1 TaxID=2804617 RepID=UPI002604208E|nr:D-alanyl-D-alanine carboxypeptidase/D-alanyl-D-alanine-endopeptidase [Sphingomonas sp. LHG3406-1]